MKDYLNFVNENYPVRRTKAEKALFRDFVLNELKDSRYSAHTETIGKNNNIVIGDVNTAKVIFTAHYDTPATTFIPTFCLPKNKFIRCAYQFTVPFFIGFFVGLISILIALRFDVLMQLPVFLVVSTVIYWGLMVGFKKNKHNKNDNTSGVAVVMSLANKCISEKVAFVLFDNEEKGLLGSKAFKKKYKEQLNDTLVINFDCVGVGNNIFLVMKKGAQNHALLKKLEEQVNSSENYNVLYIPYKKAVANSDYKVFDCGVDVGAYKKKRNIYYMGKIHTKKDTEGYTENIDFLTENMFNFSEGL